LKEIEIGNGPNRLYSSSFSGCTGIDTVKIGKDSICSKNDITVESSVFGGCTNFKTLYLNKSIVQGSNSSNAFASITKVYLGKGKISLGLCSFDGCTNLNKIIINKRS
jgi:hypothetical protein